MALRRFVSVLVRREWDRFFAIVVLLVPIWLLKPLLRGELVGTQSVKGHQHLGRLDIINTGLMPAQFHALGGQSTEHVNSTARFLLTGPLQ